MTKRILNGLGYVAGGAFLAVIAWVAMRGPWR